jgi:hypothetical protein
MYASLADFFITRVYQEISKMTFASYEHYTQFTCYQEKRVTSIIPPRILA